MGAVFVSRTIHDALMVGPSEAIEFFHGYTYSGHPMACAAGLAVLDIYQRENLFGRAADLAEYWQESVFRLRGTRHVVDIRALGLMAGVELQTREGAPGARAFEAFTHCFDAGLLIRVTGDVIALSPPLIADKADLDFIISTLAGVLHRIE